MAIRLLESRLECMTVNDENETVNGGPTYHKSKVGVSISLDNVANVILTAGRVRFRQQCPYQALALPIN